MDIEQPSLVTIEYSLIGGSGYAGTGNITANPQFVGAGVGNFRLQASSPAINAGNNAFAVGIVEDLDAGARIVGSAIDMGAYEYPVFGSLHIDSPQPVKAVILTTDGKVILQQEKAVIINTSSMPAGIYVIKIYDEDGHLAKSGRFIKMD